MTCKEAQDIIVTDYMDGRIEASLKRVIDDHLSSCRECREFLAAARSVDDLVKKTVVEPLPPSVWENIRERVEARPLGILGFWRDFWQAPSWRPAGVFVASLAVAIFVAGLWIPSGQEQDRAALTGKDDGALLSYLVDYEDRWASYDKSYGTVVEDWVDTAGTFSG